MIGAGVGCRLLPTSTFSHLLLLRRSHAYQRHQTSINARISYLMRNGLVLPAENLFRSSPRPNTVTWNAMLRGYFQNDMFRAAVHVFDTMPGRDLYSYNVMIAGLMKHGDVLGAELVFGGMVVKDVVSWNSMIVGYVHNSLLDDAIALFDGMPSRNVVTWNIVIGGLVNCGRFRDARRLFDEMPERDVASWTAMVVALGGEGRIDDARALFDEMPVQRDVRAWNALLNLYVKNGQSWIVGSLFVKMPERDADSWNEMVDGAIGCGKLEDALIYIGEMPQQQPHAWNAYLSGLIRSEMMQEAHAFAVKIPFMDTISWTNLAVGYFELGEVEAACEIFSKAPCKDVTMWNAMIFGLGKNDNGEYGLELFLSMEREGWRPDQATFTSVLDICSTLPTLDFGKQTHCQVIKMGFGCSVAVCNAIVTMYARCGSVNSAMAAFSCIEHRDLISWNSIICGLSHHGRVREALEYFKRMKLTDTKPDEVTFIGVLSSCSHTGFIDEGLYYFGHMMYKCHLQPTTEHYTCIVDILGRSGFLEQATKFIEQMRTDGVEPGATVWAALLGACRMYGNVEVGEMAGLQLLEKEPDNAGAYAIMVEMYSSGGKRKDADKILTLMKSRRVKKQPGCSWIEMKDDVHIFLAGDVSHPRINEIYETIRLIEQGISI